MKKINDIVQCSKDTAFRNDVQLGWFQSDTKENIQLVRSYIFSKQSSGERKSPIDILKMIRDAFLVRPPENRYLVIATFGHGKSHLALATANYFGQKSDAPEVKALLANIQKAYDGPSPEGSSFADFKKQRNPHLVLCLNGTKFTDLQQAFLSEIKKSLSVALGQNDVTLPFWFAEAEEFFTKLGRDDIKRLNKNLEDHDLDHASLIDRIKTHDQSVHRICLEAVRHLHRITPNWEAHISLASIIDWLVETYCGSAKPFSGILILFDEFSAFVRSYSKRSAPGSPLQDLLDGVANNRQKVVFTAFAQYDPAGWVQTMSESQSKEVLLTELDRIPKTHRFFLFNTMETILDSFLVQEEKVLDKALDEGSAWPSFQDANNRAHLLFQRRYESELHWNVEVFEKVVTRGCFPLHPATTALLCNIEFQEVGNARTVLGYVMEQVQMSANNVVVVDSTPSWVPAKSIVEFYASGELADEEWKQYKQALSTGGGDITSEQHAILRSLLLWTIAKLPTKHIKQVQAISDFAALDQSSTDQALKDLAASHVISFDEVTSKYSFFPPGGGNAKVLEVIKQRKQGKLLAWADIMSLNHNHRDEWSISDIENNVSWGAGSDWGTTQILLPIEFCKQDKIITILDKAAQRSAIFWLCAQTEAELRSAHIAVQAILDNAAGKPTKPIIFVLPSKPSPILYEKLLDQLIIEGFTPAQDQEFGSSVMAAIKTQTRKIITEEIASLRLNLPKFLAPSTMQLALSARPEIKKAPTFTLEVVKLAYHSAPPYFFDQYKQTHSKLRKSVLVVAKLLLQDGIETADFDNDPIAPQLVDKYLVSGNTNSWCILNSGLHIHKPLSTRTVKAWELLDSKIAPGEEAFFISKALQELQMPPYGYDSNTLTILFAAWLGFYRYDIQVSVGGELKAGDFFIESIKRTNTPEDFINSIISARIAIKRKDRDKEDQSIRGVLQRISICQQLPYSQEDARKDLVLLSDYVNFPGNAERDNLQTVKNGLNDLENAFQSARLYDSEAERLKTRADGAKSIQELISVCRDVGNLSMASGVSPKHPTQTDLLKDFQGCLAVLVDAHCARFSKLLKIEDFARNEDELNKPAAVLSGYPVLLHKIHEALEALSKQKTFIENERQDSVNLATLNALNPSQHLAATRRDIQSIGTLEFQLAQNRAFKEMKLAQYKMLESEFLDYVNKLPAKANEHSTAKAIQGVVNDLRTRLSAYEGTVEHEILNNLLNHYEKLSELFSQYEQIARIPLESPESINTSITTLSELLRTGSESLSEKQVQVIESKKIELQSNLQKRTDDAIAWFNKVKLDSESVNDWPKAVKEIAKPHPFLPDTEKPRLEQIRSVLAEKIQATAKQDELKQNDIRALSIMESQSKQGTVEELQSRLQIIKSLEIHLEANKDRKVAVEKTFDEAIGHAIRHRNLSNAKREDALKLTGISPSKNSGLSELRRIRALIEQTTFELPESDTKAKELRNQVDLAINKLGEFASALEMSIDNSTSQKELALIIEQINRKRFEYTDTPEFRLIEKSSSRANQLCEFLNSLAKINVEKVTNQNDVTEINNSLNACKVGLEAILSQNQRDLVLQLRKRLETKVLKLQQAADVWLEARTSILRIEELPRLLRDLDSPPPFLTADKVEFLEVLKQKTLTQLDGDEVNHVIHHFQKIADSQKRLDTIDRLQKLV